jgi:hypothetical protein
MQKRSSSQNPACPQAGIPEGCSQTATSPGFVSSCLPVCCSYCSGCWWLSFWPVSTRAYLEKEFASHSVGPQGFSNAISAPEFQVAALSRATESPLPTQGHSTTTTTPTTITTTTSLATTGQQESGLSPTHQASKY